MHLDDPALSWQSRLPRRSGSDQRASILTFPPPELEHEPLDDPGNLVPFPLPAKSPAVATDVNLPW